MKNKLTIDFALNLLKKNIAGAILYQDKSYLYGFASSLKGCLARKSESDE